MNSSPTLPHVTALSRIGQGCWGIGGEFDKDLSTAAVHSGVLRAGIDAGMSFLDTAEVYAAGFSEELVGLAIRGRRSETFVASKFSPENSHFEQVIAAAERSLRRLGTDYLDLYQVHWPNPAVPLEETIGAMNKLVADGKVRHIGVSNFSLGELQAAQAVSKVKIFSNQVEYNLFDRFCETDMLPACQRSNVLVIAYSPLNKGKSFPYRPGRLELERLAGLYGATVPQIQLSWLASQSNVVPIPKSSNLDRVRQNAGALDISLSPEDQEALDTACRVPVQQVDPSDINVSGSGEGNRAVYQTLEAALENELNLTPSPLVLAESLRGGDPLKPVRLRRNEAVDASRRYDLVEGRLRYWASVIAFGADHPVPALVY
jgi:diketogulonate reductase-like aldo/keto reductase